MQLSFLISKIMKNFFMINLQLNYNSKIDISDELKNNTFYMIYGYKNVFLLSFNYKYKNVMTSEINLFILDQYIDTFDPKTTTVLVLEYNDCIDFVLMSLLNNYNISKDKLKKFKSYEEMMFYANGKNTVLVVSNLLMNRNLDNFIEIDA